MYLNDNDSKMNLFSEDELADLHSKIFEIKSQKENEKKKIEDFQNNILESLYPAIDVFFYVIGELPKILCDFIPFKKEKFTVCAHKETYIKKFNYYSLGDVFRLIYDRYFLYNCVSVANNPLKKKLDKQELFCDSHFVGEFIVSQMGELFLCNRLSSLRREDAYYIIPISSDELKACIRKRYFIQPDYKYIQPDLESCSFMMKQENFYINYSIEQFFTGLSYNCEYYCDSEIYLYYQTRSIQEIFNCLKAGIKRFLQNEIK